jgi:hypothetical protein
MKFIVLTQGDKQIFGHGEEMHARHDRASVVRSNPFIERHIASKQLSLVASVNDEANDEELAAEWPKLLASAGGDEEQAAAAYAEIYPLVKPTKVKATPTPPAPAK